MHSAFLPVATTRVQAAAGAKKKTLAPAYSVQLQTPIEEIRKQSSVSRGTSIDWNIIVSSIGFWSLTTAILRQLHPLRFISGYRFPRLINLSKMLFTTFARGLTALLLPLAVAAKGEAAGQDLKTVLEHQKNLTTFSALIKVRISSPMSISDAGC